MIYVFCLTNDVHEYINTYGWNWKFFLWSYNHIKSYIILFFNISFSSWFSDLLSILE